MNWGFNEDEIDVIFPIMLGLWAFRIMCPVDKMTQIMSAILVKTGILDMKTL